VVVLQINKFFYEKGGTERYFFAVSEELAQRGHEVIHFSMQHPRNLESPWSEYFVPNVSYDGDDASNAGLGRGVSFIRSSQARARLRSLIAERRPDVAHLHNIYHQLTPSIIAELADQGIPMVMTLHDYKLVCPNYSLFSHGHFCFRCSGGRFYNAIREKCNGGSLARSALISAESYWQKWTGVYNSVGRLIAPSRFMRETFVAAGFDEERVMYLPGFVPEGGSDTGLTDDERTTVENLPEDFALYFGRLSPEKGLGTLLEASARLPEIPLVICGDGPEMSALRDHTERYALGHVRFTGYARRPLLEAILARAAVSILPTLSPENAPFTVLESAAAGVPVIVSDMGGLPEMAALAGGKVFPHGDARALAENIAGVCGDSENARERAQEGRKVILEHYSTQGHLQALEALYVEEILRTKAVA
jgi:glycosyltransferase involved in cell wall biosynthesis